MLKRKQTKLTLLFIAGFILAGVLHVCDRRLILSMVETQPAKTALSAFGSTVLFVLNLMIYCTLLLWWLLSVSRRLLPSRSRQYILTTAVLMILFLLVRSVKYRLAEFGSVLEHVCWYAFYVPLALIPALFLMTCLNMEPERRGSRLLTRLVGALALLLAVGVATNDLHRLMFRPIPGNPQGGAWASYTDGPLWYVFYSIIICCILLGLVVLATTDRRRHSGRRALLPALLLLALTGLVVVVDQRANRNYVPSPWAFPEAAVFGMLGILESCIRLRLIPYNENYVEFFESMQLTADITDPTLATVFHTAQPVTATAEQRRQALESPLLLDADTRLYGRALDAGYVFWTGDESTLRRLNEALEDAAEVLESENELLRFEAEQTRERVRVDTRNRVYARAEAEVYDTQKKIAVLLEQLKPGSPDYSDVLARILVLNAYVKRKTNFVLQSAERDTVTAQELYLALEESARFLAFCGMSASVTQETVRDFGAAEAAALYDSFELLVEALLDRTKNLLITMAEDALRIMAECPPQPVLPQTPARVEAACEDEQLYLTIRAEGRAET